MNAPAPQSGTTDIIFAVEGQDKHFSLPITPQTKVAEFGVLAAKEGGLEGPVEVFLEDTDEPLAGEAGLAGILSGHFAPLHVAHPGKIKVVLSYNGETVDHHFRPSATVARVTNWVIENHKFPGLDGTPTDYQLKHNGHVVGPDRHIGQVAHHHKRVELDLVLKIKVQG